MSAPCQAGLLAKRAAPSSIILAGPARLLAKPPDGTGSQTCISPRCVLARTRQFVPNRLGRIHKQQRSSGAPCGTVCILHWAMAHLKIASLTLMANLDRNWNSFQLAKSTSPLSVTDSANAPSARMHDRHGRWINIEYCNKSVGFFKCSDAVCDGCRPYASWTKKAREPSLKGLGPLGHVFT